MITLSKIYTRGGDTGETGLGRGGRLPKHHPRITAIGEVDEANAALGVACLYATGEVKALLLEVQHDLFDVGADLCVTGDEPGDLRVTHKQVDRLEQQIDRFNDTLEPLTSFVLPGGTKAAAFLHMARTVVRRAERSVIALAAKEEINPRVIHYLNRLSDLLFVLARTANNQGQADVLWQPGKGA